MRLDLVERLRCPHGHAPTPLIVVASRKRERELLEGVAGCPVCRREARIGAGHVRFEAEDDGHMAEESTVAGPGWAAELERTVALLGLAEPGGAVLLTGRYAPLADALAAAVDTAVVVMGAARLPGATERIAAVTGDLRSLPFTDGTFRAAAVDAWAPSALLADAPRAVAAGGRLLAPAEAAVPPGLKELARDDREWVAAREGTGAIVELRRRG